MKVKFKRLHESAIAPTKGSAEAAGFDLYASGEKEVYYVHKGYVTIIPTGIAVEIPKGYWGCIALRSSMGFKRGFSIPNGIGVIDSDYRGELKVAITNADLRNPEIVSEIKSGERIAQLLILPLPEVELVEADDLSDTERGTGGFGSTGR